jgi:hypothetical protein
MNQPVQVVQWERFGVCGRATFTVGRWVGVRQPVAEARRLVGVRLGR